jgi:hypothetical protein
VLDRDREGAGATTKYQDGGEVTQFQMFIRRSLTFIRCSTICARAPCPVLSSIPLLTR